MAIFGLAGGLLLIALFAFYRALNLIPTDLGFVWMTGCFVMFGASAVVAAIGMAAGRVEKAIRAGAVIGRIAEMTGATPDAASRREPAMAAPAPQEAEAASSGLGKAAAIGAAGIAAGAAASLVASAAKGDTPVAERAPSDPTFVDLPAFAPSPADDPFELPPLPKRDGVSPDDAFLAELEKDIFADLPPPTSDRTVTVLDGRITEESQNGDAAKVEIEVRPEESAAMPDPDGDNTDILDAPMEVSGPLEARESVQDDVQEEDPANEDAADPIADLIAETEAVEHASQAEAAPVEETPTVDPPAAPPAPGLIADDDLAALEANEPALAPLDSLDIVGAYDSGGTRFTMYSDGSVTAIGPTIDRRFVSLDALRAFIDGGAKA